MNKKNLKRKLMLKKETVARLSGNELAGLQGKGPGVTASCVKTNCCIETFPENGCYTGELSVCICSRVNMCGID